MMLYWKHPKIFVQGAKNQYFHQMQSGQLGAIPYTPMRSSDGAF